MTPSKSANTRAFRCAGPGERAWVREPGPRPGRKATGSGRLHGGAAPSRRPGVPAGPGRTRAVSFQPHGQCPDPRPEPDHNRHLHHVGGRARRHNAADERALAGRHHRSEPPDVPPRLLAGPRHDLPGRPGAGQRLREHLGELAWPAAAWSVRAAGRPAAPWSRPARGCPVRPARGCPVRQAGRAVRSAGPRSAAPAWRAVWCHVRGATIRSGGRSASPNIPVLACGGVPVLACGLELVVVRRRGIGHCEPADRGRVGQWPALVGWPAQVGYERQHRRPQRCWGRRPMAGGRGWLRHVMSCTRNR